MTRRVNSRPGVLLGCAVEKLSDEERKLKEHTERVMARLTQERDGWFLCRSAKLAKTETITQFLQLCLFPRCVFTALDALFCARFVRVSRLSLLCSIILHNQQWGPL